jgi:hypothetical protein
MFKSFKDKLINFVQKENNASVRDASVSLLITFKMLLPDCQTVRDAVHTLPKYRIAEINKKATERVAIKPLSHESSSRTHLLSE